MTAKKKIYPINLQKSIIKDAVRLIKERYDNDPTVLAIYLGGSAVDNELGEYTSITDKKERQGSDIDVMVIINNRHDNTDILSKKEQVKYGIRHLYPKTQIPVYRIVTKNKDILLYEKHPIELMILSKNYFIGRLSGKITWKTEHIPFSKEMKKMKNSQIIKESEEIRKLRVTYTIE